MAVWEFWHTIVEKKIQRINALKRVRAVSLLLQDGITHGQERTPHPEISTLGQSESMVNECVASATCRMLPKRSTFSLPHPDIYMSEGLGDAGNIAARAQNPSKGHISY